MISTTSAIKKCIAIQLRIINDTIVVDILPIYDAIVAKPAKKNKTDTVKNKGTGAGGANTNKTGLSYEKKTTLEENYP